MGEPGGSNAHAGIKLSARRAVKPGAQFPYAFTARLIMSFLSVTIVACTLTDKEFYVKISPVPPPIVTQNAFIRLRQQDTRFSPSKYLPASRCGSAQPAPPEVSSLTRGAQVPPPLRPPGKRGGTRVRRRVAVAM